MTYHPSKRPRWLPAPRNRRLSPFFALATLLILFSFSKIVTRPRRDPSPAGWVGELLAAWA